MVDFAESGGQREPEARRIGGMPETRIFWNGNDTISVEQDNEVEATTERITIDPHMVDVFVRQLHEVRDEMLKAME